MVWRDAIGNARLLSSVRYAELLARVEQLRAADQLSRDEQHAVYLRVQATERRRQREKLLCSSPAKLEHAESGDVSAASGIGGDSCDRPPSGDSTSVELSASELSPLEADELERQVADLRMIALDVPRTMLSLRVFADSSDQSAPSNQLKRVLMASLLLEHSVGFTQGKFVATSVFGQRKILFFRK